MSRSLYGTKKHRGNHTKLGYIYIHDFIVHLKHINIEPQEVNNTSTQAQTSLNHPRVTKSTIPHSNPILQKTNISATYISVLGSTSQRSQNRRSHSTHRQALQQLNPAIPTLPIPVHPLVAPPIPQSQPQTPKMRLSTLLTQVPLACASQLDPTLGSTLNVTVLGARHNRSTLECWALQPGFETSTQPGTSGSSVLDLGAVQGNASFTAIPAEFDGGRHNAPALQ
jgi:hypothetical protein